MEGGSVKASTRTIALGLVFWIAVALPASAQDDDISLSAGVFSAFPAVVGGLELRLDLPATTDAIALAAEMSMASPGAVMRRTCVRHVK